MPFQYTQTSQTSKYRGYTTAEITAQTINTAGLKQNKAASQNILDIEILNDSSNLSVLVEYTASRYERFLTERFGPPYVSIAENPVRESDDAVTVEELCKRIR